MGVGIFPGSSQGCALPGRCTRVAVPFHPTRLSWALPAWPPVRGEGVALASLA